MLVGNAISTILYTANGESSDWMLGELGIYAVSVELGGETQASRTWFIEDKEVLKDVLKNNERWMTNTMLYLEPVIECTGTDTVVTGQAAENEGDVVALTAY